MRRPKGIKTKKSAAKRFKITARGKILRSRAGKRHLLQGKSPKRRRGLGGTTTVPPTDEYRIKQNMPLTHQILFKTHSTTFQFNKPKHLLSSHNGGTKSPTSPTP